MCDCNILNPFFYLQLVVFNVKPKLKRLVFTKSYQWMQRLKRVFAIDIETCPECGGKLRVIACIEDPPLIAKILGQVRRREALVSNAPRSPPVLQPELTFT
jgi:hypothetical protein